ncbi:hypothetical protein [Budvicia aquatica]|uniref:Uncharacterized protein n=1 Tax=Budvicia aquatica TaxID=82979 RepID=A0A2C6DJ88_9GAMM|nr:hypothetical protein [Budvicia aquatica]MBP9643284.1 hypothetical protein [Budvicia sp.]PHI31296.1 hypothetical protein CRN84_19105 [Budvicia aquatica]GKX51808.1 hypothetical protein SOASR029_21170 [Budvicia aquatica]VFS51598.1 Uncharacterised protein [Budvicia aquatica]
MKGNGHFWPAYVDMMTVLLLVYLLISMIFQVLLIVAQQNVGIKLSEQRQVEIRSISQELRPNELRMILDSNQNYLGSKNQKELISWLEKNKEVIEQNGVTIYAAAKEGKQMGVSLTLQYDRCLEVLRVMQQHGVSTKKATINNSSVNIFQEDFAAVYIKQPATSSVRKPDVISSSNLNEAQIPSVNVESTPAAAGGL